MDRASEAVRETSKMCRAGGLWGQGLRTAELGESVFLKHLVEPYLTETLTAFTHLSKSKSCIIKTLKDPLKMVLWPILGHNSPVDKHWFEVNRN